MSKSELNLATHGDVQVHLEIILSQIVLASHFDPMVLNASMKLNPKIFDADS